MFDPGKLKENAITSIRLGIEDFLVSKASDPDRSLSAVRNLFAGVLLLLKFRITKGLDANIAHTLIFTPTEVLPFPDGKGGIVWQPQGKFKSQSIDLATIKKRFATLGIGIDWSAVDKLQAERNNLEHLHPASTVGALAGFVADLFPVLRDFISNELDEDPAILLGTAWTSMLEHHAFFRTLMDECEDAWGHAAVPSGMVCLMSSVQCEVCASPLLKPLEVGVPVDTYHHRFKCLACGSTGETIPLFEKTLIEYCGGFDPYDGDECPTAECPSCENQTFVHSKAECLWCGDGLDYSECAVCGNSLSLDEQEHEGLCSYHRYVADKDD